MPRPAATIDRARALARDLSAKTRRRHAKVRFVEETPFGALAVRRYTLGNGLTVLLLPDRSAPVVSYETWFRVGSRHEEPGKTGLAHLLEHLMFNGTKSHPSGELDRLFEAVGADTNAGTLVDWTYYYESFPKKALSLAIALESDRMRNLVLREEEVASEREVVLNERATSVDDDVGGYADEQLYRLAFRRHPYGHPVIGDAADIRGLTTEDCRSFYLRYYAPNNAILVVVGDIDEAEALAEIQDAYGKMEPQPLPERRATPEPRQRRPRRRELRYETATPKVALGYVAPPFADPDWAVLELARHVLFGGRSSRLYRALVEEGELCTEAHGSVAPFEDPGLFELWLSLRPGVEVERALAVLDAELARLATEPVAERELEKVKNRRELSLLSSMDTAEGKADQVGFYATVLGDVSRVFGRLEEYRAVTPEAIRRVAAERLAPARRSMVVVHPQGGGA